MSDLTIRKPHERTAVATLPKRPPCPACNGGGYLAIRTLPRPLTAKALCGAVLACECPAGQTIRDLQAEMRIPAPTVASHVKYGD